MASIDSSSGQQAGEPIDRESHPPPPRQGFPEAVRCAGSGIARVWRREPNFRRQVAAGLAATVTGACLGLAPVEWAVLALTIALVLSLECANSALEALADALHPGHCAGVGHAKDIAAGAVWAASLGALAVGLCLFLPKLLALTL